MDNNQIYLTFKTDRETSEMLKFLAQIQETSQPKLIDEICKNYINEQLIILNKIAEEKLKEIGIDPELHK